MTNLLSKIAAKPCLIEPFRNQPSKIDIQTGLQKLFTLRSELLNKAKRDNKLEKEEGANQKSLKEEALPQLWILATSASDNLLNFFGGKLDLSNWCEGVYFCGAEGVRTAIISINRLPPTPETLLVRLLGKGETQNQAIKEIRALPEDNALRNHVEGLLYRWRIYVKAKDDFTPDDKELLMNFSEIYREHQEKLLQQGLQQGLKRSQEIMGNLLVRFGVIDQTLSQVIEPLLKLPPKESSRLILQSSREELVAKLSH